MFWWRHTGPRVAWLTCSEILIFSINIRNICKSSNKYSHPPPSYWWLNSRKYKPQVTVFYQWISEDSQSIKPSVSIKSQLIIKSCWVELFITGQHWDRTGLDWWPQRPGPARTNSGLRVSWSGRPGHGAWRRPGLVWPAEVRPEPFTTIHHPRHQSLQSLVALKWNLAEEIITFFISCWLWSRAWQSPPTWADRALREG